MIRACSQAYPTLREQAMRHELRVWVSLDHPNVLPLLGVAITDELPSLVSEWMEESTMSKYLKNHSESINADRKLVIVCSSYSTIAFHSFMISLKATGIASGLAYLHECGVVHSDLKSV